ncbi:hypothetical protein BZG36_03399 [Bifiguratus adelaidae]|uniref:RNA polymerase II degradation factor 1 n=1 Tax=Bifiguratus adelaidae TaxID=1938954 RepID=A0A261Y0H7_9FUNG|nr:hypothetical protein BZG36_03399 [Bifiguratus adelaidae]
MTTQDTRPKGDRTKSQVQDSDEVKLLRSQYGSTLPTLKEMFPDWKEEDLLFAVKEADGDIELAVGRISEGHANQWGEVLSKKQKNALKEKTKPAQPVATNASAGRGAPNDRGRGRDGRGRGDRGRGASRGGPSARGARPSAPAAAAATAATTAASGWGSNDAAPSTASGWDSAEPSTAAPGWVDESTTAATTGWSDTLAPSQPVSATSAPKTAPSAAAPATAHAPAKTAPSSWASIFKQPPKPEPVPEPVQPAKPATDSKTHPQKLDSTLPTSTIPSQPKADNESLDKTAKPAAEEQREATYADSAKNDVQYEKSTAFDSKDSPIAPPGFGKPKTPIARRLKQDAPVVMPSGNSALGSVGVQFGSLSLNDNEPSTTSYDETADERNKLAASDASQTQQLQNPSVQSSQQPSQIPSQAGQATSQFGRAPIAQNAANASAQQNQYAPQSSAFGSASYLKQQQADTTNLPGGYMGQQPQVPGQMQQQHPGTTEHAASPYGNYLPNQTNPALSGFGMGPMGSLPSGYGDLYGDAGRGNMGYYDPSSYNQNQSTAAYQGRDNKYSADQSTLGGTTPTGTNASQAGQQSIPGQHQQSTPQQQAYPNMGGMPYYYPYYMPNQYPTYQQSGYGQPYMNKNMYPMYNTQHSHKPGAAHSPYGLGNQHLYQSHGSPAASSPYDDMSGLHNQSPVSMGAMGAHDYGQKGYMGNQQGFFGGASSQQPQAGGLNSQQKNASGSNQGSGDLSGISPYKYGSGDKSGSGNATGSQQSGQGQAGAANLNTQSQAGMHMNPSYYGQQMFGYGYPQSQQYQSQGGYQAHGNGRS